MKKLHYLSLAIGAILIFTNCNKCIVEPTNTHIHFNNLAVGQKSLYVRFESRNVWSDSDTTFKQMADTLVLRVVAQDSNGFKIAEEIFPRNIATFYYYFNIKNDSLYVKPLPSAQGINSVVFNFGATTFTLKDNNLPKWTLNQWGKPKDLTIVEAFGKNRRFSIFG